MKATIGSQVIFCHLDSASPLNQSVAVKFAAVLANFCSKMTEKIAIDLLDCPNNFQEFECQRQHQPDCGAFVIAFAQQLSEHVGNQSFDRLEDLAKIVKAIQVDPFATREKLYVMVVILLQLLSDLL